MKKISRFVFTISLLSLLASCGGVNDGDGGSSAAPEYKIHPPAADGKKVKVAFVTNMVADFWTIGEAGAHQAAKDLGVDVEVIMPVGGTVGQKKNLEDLMSTGVDGIAVSPRDPASQTDLLNQLASHTNLITHDSDAPDTNRLAYVGVDNYTAGRLCGELVKEALPDGGKIMILVGTMDQDNAKHRRQGVIDELLDRSVDPTRFDKPQANIKNDKYTIINTLTDEGSSPKSKTNAEDTLSNYPDIDAFVGLFAYNPPTILEALKGSDDKLGKVKVIGFDEDDATLQGILDGHIHGTIVQNPYQYGYESVRILAGLAKGDASVIPESRFIDIPARKIRTDNVQAFWDDLKEKTGKK